MLIHETDTPLRDASIIQCISLLLSKGVNKEHLYNSLCSTIHDTELSEDKEDDIADALDILSGYHNPYTCVTNEGVVFDNIKVNKDVNN